MSRIQQLSFPKHATSNKGIATSNKKLLVTGVSLLVTIKLLVKFP